MQQNENLIQEVRRITLELGLPALCERLISAGKALESLSEPISNEMRTCLGDEVQRLMSALSTGSPAHLDPVSLITLISTIPITVKQANRVAGIAYSISSHMAQEKVVSNLVHAMVENLKRNKTIEHEMAHMQAANPRFAGDLIIKITDFETDLITIPYELACIDHEHNLAQEYLEHVFSLDIKSNDASMDPKAQAISAMLQTPAPAWPAMKRWLDDNQSLVTRRLLDSGWHKDFKPKLFSKAEEMGLTWLSSVLIKRGFRFNPEDFLDLEANHFESPDMGTYEISLLGPDGKPAPADDKTLIAMLAHALAYENVMPDYWITHENSSALKLLSKAMDVLRSKSLVPEPERLKQIFDLCARKLRKDNELDWLENTEFKHLLNGSLGYRGVKFTQELGI